MFRTLLTDLFYLPIKVLRFDFLFKWFLPWHGQRPTFAMLFKFYRDSDLVYHSQSKLHLLDFKSIKDIDQNTSYFAGQEILENEAADIKLLNKSSLHLYPHEVTQVRIINAQKEEFNSKIYHGGPYEGLDGKTLRQEIRSLCFKARQKGLIIEEVEIAHTHPALEVMVTSQQQSSFFFNGLSSGDHSLGKSLAPFIDYPLRVKAISPAANYSRLY